MYLDAFLMYDCLYILVMSFSLVFNYFYFIINVYTFVFVICLIWQYLFIGHYFMDLYVIPWLFLLYCLFKHY